jgi:hypothetical protein
MRGLLERGDSAPGAFRSALLAVAALDQDAWVDVALGLAPPPDDGPGLPSECVPYLPCPIGAVLRALELAQAFSGDVFVDVGAGVGRALAVAALVTGCRAVGVEVQASLAGEARRTLGRLRLTNAEMLEGDAAALPGISREGSVFFLYCPFSGERLQRLLAELRAISSTREISICCVDLPLPPLDWLEPVAPPAGDLTVYRSLAKSG